MQHALSEPHARLELRSGCHADFLHQLGPKLVDAKRNGTRGFQHEIDGSETQRLQRHVRASRRPRRDHDDRAWVLDHDAIEAFETAHLRHLNVERDDGWPELLEPLQGFDPVARELDFEIGLFAEDAAKKLAHQRRVVHDEDLDHASSRATFWKASSRSCSAAVRSSSGSSTSTMRSD